MVRRSTEMGMRPIFLFLAAVVLQVAASGLPKTSRVLRGRARWLSGSLSSTRNSTTTTTQTTATTTSLVAATTTTTTTAGSSKYSSSLTMQLADPEAFVNSNESKIIMDHSIAESNPDITQSMVNTTSIELSASSRLLSEHPRRLAAGGVAVSFTITYPGDHSNNVFTQESINTDALITAVTSKASDLGITLNVTGVTVNAVTCSPCGQGSTPPPGTTTTTTTATVINPGMSSGPKEDSDDTGILIAVIVSIVFVIGLVAAAFSFYLYRRRIQFDKHCEAIRQLETEEDEYSAHVVQFTEKMEGQGGFCDRLSKKKASNEPFSEEKHTMYLEEWKLFLQDHKAFIELYTGAWQTRRQVTGEEHGTANPRRTSVDRMRANPKKQMFPEPPPTPLPQVQEQHKKLVDLRTRIQDILSGFLALSAELDLKDPPLESIGSNRKNESNDLPYLSGLGVDKDPALIEQAEMLKRLAHPLLAQAIVKPYGVLGSSEGKPDPNPFEPVDAVIIDPAGFPYIGAKNNPVGAGAASGSIYRWLGIAKAGGFPENVHAAFDVAWEGEAEMRAKYHAYKEGQHVIHTIGPKIRELLEGLSDLTRTYVSVFTEYCTALDAAKAPSNSTIKPPRILRLLPISSGVFLVNKKLERYMAQLTWSALSVAFASLPPSAQEQLKTCTIEVCIFQKKEVTVYESILAEKQIIASGRPMLTLPRGGVGGPGSLPAKKGGFDWIRLKNGPADRLDRLLGFLLTEQVIWSRGFNLPDGKVMELGDLSPMLKGTRIRRVTDDFNIRSLSGIGLDVRSAEAATVMEVAIRSQTQGKKTVAVSAASAYAPGGAALSGGRHALEETWCTMSTLLKSITHAKQETQADMTPAVSSSLSSATGRQVKPHIPVDGCIVSPGVEIFRDTSATGYSFQASTTKLLGVVSVAMFNMNPRMNDSPQDAPRDFIDYCKQVKQKFVAMTKAAAEMGAEVLVCPDIGCGVFENDPTVVGTMLGEALSELPGFFSEVWITGKTAFFDAVSRSAQGGKVKLERPPYYFTSGGPYECGQGALDTSPSVSSMRVNVGGEVLTSPSINSMKVNVGGDARERGGREGSKLSNQSLGGTSASVSQQHSGNIGSMRSGAGAAAKASGRDSQNSVISGMPAEVSGSERSSDSGGSSAVVAGHAGGSMSSQASRTSASSGARSKDTMNSMAVNDGGDGRRAGKDRV